MKKFLTITLVVVMMMTLVVGVFAAGEVTANNGSSTGDITVSVGTADAGKVYYVDVQWDSDLDFDFTVTKTWLPASHSYGYAGAWADDDHDADITVVNHSNADVTATFAAGSADPFEVSFSGATDNKVALDAATEGTEQNAAPSATVKVTVEATEDQEELKDIYDAGNTTKNISVTVTITDPSLS